MKIPCEICGIRIRNNVAGAYYNTGGPTGRCHIKCYEQHVKDTSHEMAQLAYELKQATNRMRAQNELRNIERGKLLVKLKEMAREFKTGNCNRGLVWAMACAFIEQCERITQSEKQRMISQWDRLAGLKI